MLSASYFMYIINHCQPQYSTVLQNTGSHSFVTAFLSPWSTIPSPYFPCQSQPLATTILLSASTKQLLKLLHIDESMTFIFIWGLVYAKKGLYNIQII